MTIRCSAAVALRGLLVAALACGLGSTSGPVAWGQVPGNQNSRMATFDHAGETFFALSLVPQISDAQQRAADIVVYVDTSASQVGEYKQGSLLALKRFLTGLNAEDRVKICAVDLDPIPLTEGFVDSSSPEVEAALRSLEQRTPLGSTDFDLLLETASSEFEGSEGKNRSVVYIGDGVARTGSASALVQHIKNLASRQISVSSYIYGATRDAELMATLANHTGGNLFIHDEENENATTEGALFMCQTVHNPVFWPKNSQLDKSLVTVFPAQTPPLRTDRDTILIGTLANRDELNLAFSGDFNGENQKLDFQIKPEAGDVEFAFLPALMKRARADQGATLPALGSAGLREIKGLLKSEAEQLAALSSQAVVNGDSLSAKTLAAAAIAANPADTRNNLLVMSTSYRGAQDQDDPFAPSNEGTDDPSTPPQSDPQAPAQEPADSPFGDAPSQDDGLDPAADSEAAPEAESADSLPAGSEDVAPNQDVVESDSAGGVIQQTEDPGRMTLIDPAADDLSSQPLQDQYQRGTDNILTEEARLRIVNERARKQVEFEQKRAREEMLTNPDAAIERIKNSMEILDQASDLSPSTRQDLRYSLQSALLSFRQRKMEFDDRRAREIELKAVADNQRLRSVRLLREEEELAQLVDRFNTLLEERNYASAIAVTDLALEKAPNDPHIVAAAETAIAMRNIVRLQELRALKANKFVEALYMTELATVPFPDNQWLVYPDPEVWRQKVLRRAKWQDIRLAGSPIDESILRTLEEPVDLDYEEMEWGEVRRDLFNRFKINIVTDPLARDAGLEDEELVSIQLSGVRLKYALREMLKAKEATFVVKDEVLRVIPIENAEDPEFLVTNVYNVGDLVAPRRSPGGMMGGMMGGMGGMMGGMGGGMGGMGMGGMGMGGMGGGMGGAFCVQEPTGRLQLDSNSSPVATVAPVVKPNKGQRIVLETADNAELAWNSFFAANANVDSADVRETVRLLMHERKSEEVVHLISAAIRHDQLQPWMYEAITLAMRISGFPKSEIERAVMSAVDLSIDPNDLLIAAQFLAANGMEKRSLRLLRDIALASPTNPEPYLIGLQAAQKTNDLAGIKWAVLGIFGQEWPDFPSIVQDAKLAADAVRMTLKKQGLTEELEAFENDLLNAQVRDCFIEVKWTGDADLDIYVAEPNGTICSRLERRTTGGGIYFGDKFSPKSDVSGQTTEHYVLPRGFSGNYQLLIRRVWGEVTSNKVTVSIHQHYRSPKEGSLTRQVALDEIGAVVLFALADGRRTDSLEDNAIQTVVKHQMAKNRFFFAQQTEAGSGYGSGGSGSGSGGINPGGLVNNPNFRNGFANGNLWGGAVGYRPIITQIFEGPMLQVNHATTADRLHVLVSLSPTFTQITSVSTFNIFGTAETAEGVAGGAGGGGGGVGGGGAGGGGVF